jgi:hypothetical protein
MVTTRDHHVKQSKPNSKILVLCFFSYVESRDKRHESRRGTIKKEEGEWGGEIRESNGVNVIKVCYRHVRKCHNETLFCTTDIC